MAIKYDGLDEIYNKIQTIIKDSKSQKVVTDILQNFGVITKSRIRENFNKGLDPYGITWAPLKAGGRYIKNGKGKGKLDTSAKPLLDTGRLVGSINYKVSTGKDNASTILIYNKDVTGTSTSDYGVYHQYGLGVTARPFLPTVERGIPESWYRDLDRITEKLINKLANS